MKNRYSSLLKIFTGVQVAGYLMLILLLTSGYIYLITSNVTVALSVGVITTLVLFDYNVYLPKKLEREQYLLKELQKYATAMTFYMQSGHNVFHSLQSSKENLDKEVQKDIDKTIKNLQDKAEIDTSHFNKYKFPAIDIFHQILKIKYEIGGNAKDLFSKVNQSVNFEIVKRDELYREKKYMKSRITLMMTMVLSMPLLFVLFANDIYVQFLELGILAIGMNVVLFTLTLISLVFLQRTVTDISIID